MIYRIIPLEIQDHIFIITNNKCKVCQVICKIPYKKLGKYYYCSLKCFNYC